jgi:hypothetical protein
VKNERPISGRQIAAATIAAIARPGAKRQASVISNKMSAVESGAPSTGAETAAAPITA